jgi:Holliday junction resolvase RusA-like endonuclease
MFDTDNRIKPVQDALELAGVFDDDEQIERVCAEKREVVKGGLCKIVLMTKEEGCQLMSLPV